MSDGGFNSPAVAGSGQLILPSVHSPGYLAGVTGWAIKKDGTVEFSSGVFRGTVTGGVFDGTDFEINPAGAFFYGGTPAAGNLIASVAVAASSDVYGNAFPKGFNAQKSALNADAFGNLVDGILYLGVNAGGVQDIPHASKVYGNGQASLVLYSGTATVPNIPDAGIVLLQGGNHITGPSLTIQDNDGVADMLAALHGGLFLGQLQAGTIPLDVFQAAGATADIIRARSNASVALFRVDNAGNIPVVGTINQLATVATEDITARTVTTTAYGNGSSLLSLTSVVPASGKALITVLARMDNASAVNTLTSFTVTGSTSGSLYAASDAKAAQWNMASSAGPLVTQTLITGAIPGETITVACQHRVASASTGNIRYRSITIQPCAA